MKMKKKGDIQLHLHSRYSAEPEEGCFSYMEDRVVYGYSRERNSLPNRINISTSTTFAGLNLPEFNGKALVNIHFGSLSR